MQNTQLDNGRSTCLCFICAWVGEEKERMHQHGSKVAPQHSVRCWRTAASQCSVSCQAHGLFPLQIGTVWLGGECQDTPIMQLLVSFREAGTVQT